ncbi:hypothetical protein D3P09_23475 [Paenibacillus pinisoli]|uniref:Uncharacterized protein n=1 Tax=Paenibacillus pinisoli TaxID=1276110 RepID=A0A3A6PC66_9BACL|nr:hypothetical protein [Paenibacillus pinisoli]RJX37316.1 hypothetical protein D3P09_23475 [Paenibacillus pinisoli]
MTREGHRALSRAELLIAAAILAMVIAGCQKGTPNLAAEEGSPEPSPLTTPITFQIDASTQSPSSEEALSEEPLLIDGQPENEPERPHWLRDAAYENEYASILHQLEYETLMILSQAAEKRFANKDEAPSFEELRKELLKYNAEQRLDPWQTIYENDPGWLLEPSELLYAVNMYEPSLELSRDDEDKVRLSFKTYGQDYQEHTVSRHMEIELLRSGESWRIGDIKSRTAEYAFAKEDAEHILTSANEYIQYIGDDETHYLFQDEQGQPYVFHKKHGYYTKPDNI